MINHANCVHSSSSSCAGNHFSCLCVCVIVSDSLENALIDKDFFIKCVLELLVDAENRIYFCTFPAGGGGSKDP